MSTIPHRTQHTGPSGPLIDNNAIKVNFVDTIPHRTQHTGPSGPLIDNNAIKVNFVDTSLHFHLETEELPASKTSRAVQNIRNLCVREKHSLHIKAIIS